MIDEDLLFRPDNINPLHYRQGNIEAIDAMEAMMTRDEFRGYLKASALKYIWREKMKGSTESILKAMWFLEKLAEFDEKNNAKR